MSHLIERAAQFAAAAHAAEDQKRKYTGEPYIVHPRAVAHTVASVPHDEAMVAAAWLHDVVEDTPVTLQQITDEFGEDVASLVSDLTDAATRADGNRATRTAINLEHSAQASARAQTVKLADVLDNLSNIVDFDPAFAPIYINEKELLLPLLREGDPALYAKVHAVIQSEKAKLSRLKDSRGEQDRNATPEKCHSSMAFPAATAAARGSTVRPIPGHVVSQEMQAEIIRRLQAAEVEHDIKILLACESGSRAWGFASPDSDYDVRFIYVHRRDWYLSFDVDDRRDVVEYPIVDEVDCSGWDLRKALFLFTRTNGALLEWLQSPLVYVLHGTAAGKLLSLAQKNLNSTALRYHYLHMAQRNAKDILGRDKVKLKKYLYVLRPLLALRFIVSKMEVPPMRFGHLVEESADMSLRPIIAELLERKVKTPEKGFGDPIPELDQFIERELGHQQDLLSATPRPLLMSHDELRLELNGIFRDSISEAWSESG